MVSKLNLNKDILNKANRKLLCLHGTLLGSPLKYLVPAQLWGKILLELSSPHPQKASQETRGGRVSKQLDPGGMICFLLAEVAGEN